MVTEFELKQDYVKQVVAAIEKNLERGNGYGLYRIVVPAGWAEPLTMQYSPVRRISILERIFEIDGVNEVAFRKGLAAGRDGIDVVAEQLEV